MEATQKKVTIHQIPGALEDARQKAMSVAMETHREQAPVRIFKQGDREMISGVLPVKVMTRILDYNSAAKGETADKALDATNRPVIKDHWVAFANYLKKALEEEQPFIIPPLTLNATGDLHIYVPEGQEATNSGYAVLPDEMAIHITDGQHRFIGIKDVVDKTRGSTYGEKFMNTGVPFMMTIEADTNQVHQDFADAGRTKALPPSLLAVYDTRQPANAAVMSIIEKVPLLKGRVDATSSSVGKGSCFIFLVNQVRQFVKHSLTGSTGATETSFNDQAFTAMNNRESRDSWVRSRIAFLNIMTEIVPDWNEVAQLSAPYGADSATVLQRTKEIKARQNVPLNGAFLTTLGIVSYNVLRDLTNADIEDSEMAEYLRERLKPFKDIDWSREGSIWDGNIVTGGKIRTQAPAVKGASQKMLELLALTEQATEA